VPSEAGTIHAPQPVSFGSSSMLSNSSSTASVSATPSPHFELPSYPTLPQSVMSDLPAPLHSKKGKTRGRHEHTGAVELTPDLDWREDDWVGLKAEGSGSGSATLNGRALDIPGEQAEVEQVWKEVTRIKGGAEDEEEGEGEESCRSWSEVEMWVELI
jgi:hypothetical protein